MSPIDPKKYDVAFSFAGEEREFVAEVAGHLKDKGVRVFYDEYEEIDLWGKELAIALEEIYRHRARYVVVFISENYAKKIWTQLELKTVLSAALNAEDEYILPFRFDDTELKGLSPSVAYLDLSSETPRTLAAKIQRKVQGAGHVDLSDKPAVSGVTKVEPAEQPPPRKSRSAWIIPISILTLLAILWVFWFAIETKPSPEVAGPAVKVEPLGAARAALRMTDPILEVSDLLMADPDILASYRDFLRPFIAIDTAAELAVAGVDNSDERWLSLDPTDRDLAREAGNSIQWLEEMAFWYAGDDLRNYPVFNIASFAEKLIFQEKSFSEAQVLANLKASHRVALALGQNVGEPPQWPDTFFFPAFLHDAELQDVATLVDHARQSIELPLLRNHIRELEDFCKKRDIVASDCSPGTIRWQLDRASSTGG